MMPKYKKPIGRVKFGTVEIYDPILDQRTNGRAVAIVTKQCRAKVFDQYFPHQCYQPGAYPDEGYVFCLRHLPSSVKAKRDKKQAEYDFKVAALAAKKNLNELFCQVAQTAIDYYEQKVSFEDIERAVVDWRKAKTLADEMKGTGEC